jgi:hypothetical protein
MLQPIQVMASAIQKRVEDDHSVKTENDELKKQMQSAKAAVCYYENTWNGLSDRPLWQQASNNAVAMKASAVCLPLEFHANRMRGLRKCQGEKRRIHTPTC